MVIYTDGSASPNPGKGGFGIVVYDNQNNLVKAYSHHEDNTTNNRQELKAIIFAALMYGEKQDPDSFFQTFPIVYSDSSYCINTLTSWMFSWERNGWRKSDKQIPENLDLIQEYYDWYQQGYRIDLRKVKGHAGTEGNEIADQLAGGFITPEEVYKKYGN